MAKKVDYSTIADMRDFTVKNANIRKRGKTVKADFVALCQAAVKFFHGEANHNIQVVNDLVTTAYECGINGGHIIDWFENVVPHKIVKDKDNKRRFKFGAKVQDREYNKDVADKFITEYGNPFEWGKQGVTTPENFDPMAYLVTVAGKLEKEGVDVKQWAEQLAKAAEEKEAA